METIKEIRTAYNLTQKALSDITGIPKRTIENWEGGKSKTPKWLCKMIVAYINSIKE